MKRQLDHQITDEFREAFVQPEPDTSVCDIRQLTEACLVLDVLGEESKQKIVTWFVNLQLRDYKTEFHQSKGMAWLDKIDKRFAWLKRTLASYRETCADIFPKDWHMAEVISTRFCEITRDEMQRLVTERRDQLEVQILMFALKKSTEFETWLASRFPSREWEEVTEEAADGGASEEGEEMTSGGRRASQRYGKGKDPAVEKPQKLKPSHFIGRLTKIFEGYMDVYVEAQERNLETMLEAFAEQFKKEGVGSPDDVEEEEGGQTLGSSGDMFRFFRDCIVQCNELNSMQALHDLTLVFKKYLGLYAKRILMANLPKSSTLAATLLKDVGNNGDIKLTTDEQYTACCMLNTAEYCLDTTDQLEGKLKQKLGDEKVDMMGEQDAYHEVITNCIQLLVRALETQCDPGLTTMVR